MYAKGQKLEMLTLVRKTENQASDGSYKWLCRCKCGNTVEEVPRKIGKGKRLSCGCARSIAASNWDRSSIRLDLKGQTFGRLTVIKYLPREGWHCKCQCGNSSIVQSKALTDSRQVSCGCFNAKVNGHAKTREHTSWYAAKQRCRNIKHKQYYAYGGRGITFSKKWDDIEVFIADMGPCPEGMSLERVNPNKGYSKNNCVWTTWLLQCTNRRKTSIAKLKAAVIAEFKAKHIPKSTYNKYMEYIKAV